MIIASLKQGDDPAVLVGLSRKNAEELIKGHPIFKPKEETGLPVTLIIVGGETEESIMAELKEHFNIPDEVIDDRKAGHDGGA